jgi:hypothetical protein
MTGGVSVIDVQVTRPAAGRHAGFAEEASQCFVNLDDVVNIPCPRQDDVAGANVTVVGADADPRFPGAHKPELVPIVVMPFETAAVDG